MEIILKNRLDDSLILFAHICSRMEDVKPVKVGWYNAFRPWTLHGAIIPVLIGGAIAYHDGFFCWWIFLLVMIGGCLLQSAANLLNTYGDFVLGTDTAENHTRSPELVTGALKPKSVFRMGILCLVITALIGVVFIWYVGWGILIIGLVGIAGAALYTIGISYKYHATGLFSVFFLMGILMPIGTYYVLTGNFSWEVLLLSLPNAFFITAVLSGNETRDYFEDKKSNVGTLSGKLSYENSKRLYLILCSIPYPLISALVIIGQAPIGCLLALLSLWNFRKIYLNSKNAPENPKASFMLVPLAFKANWIFGLLLVAGYLISLYAFPGVAYV